MPDNQCMFNEQRNTSFYTVEIWLLPLNFFLTVDGHLENPTIVNLSRFGEFQKQTVNSIYLALKIFNFIPANSAK